MIANARIRFPGRRALAFSLVLLVQVGCDTYDPDQAGASVPACRASPFTLNADSPDQSHQPEPCQPTVCALRPDGALEMSYCVQGGDGSWATCRAAAGQDLNGFDPDNQGQGMLEVVFCVDAPPGGPAQGFLNLWYGNFPKRKYLTLLGEGQQMSSGCAHRYFTPDEPCFFDRADPDLLPASCALQCGPTSPECHLDFGAVPLNLTAEWGKVGSSARVRLLSVTHLSAGCACQGDWDCAPGSRSVCQNGVCVAGGTAECGDLVGRYADGWRPGPSDAFTAAFLAHDPRLGCPFDNGGNAYVHEARGVAVQDYLQPDASKRISPDGQSVLLLGPSGKQAFLLYGDFWAAYKCLGDGGQAMGGATVLGAPTGERELVGDTVQQSFERGSLRGWSVYPPEESRYLQVEIDLDAHANLDPDPTAGCDNPDRLTIYNPP